MVSLPFDRFRFITPEHGFHLSLELQGPYLNPRASFMTLGQKYR